MGFAPGAAGGAGVVGGAAGDVAVWGAGSVVWADVGSAMVVAGAASAAVRRDASARSSMLRWSHENARSRLGEPVPGAPGHGPGRRRSMDALALGRRVRRFRHGSGAATGVAVAGTATVAASVGRCSELTANFSAMKRPFASSLSESWRAMSSATSARRLSIRLSWSSRTSCGVRPPAMARRSAITRGMRR